MYALRALPGGVLVPTSWAPRALPGVPQPSGRSPTWLNPTNLQAFLSLFPTFITARAEALQHPYPAFEGRIVSRSMRCSVHCSFVEKSKMRDRWEGQGPVRR